MLQADKAVTGSGLGRAGYIREDAAVRRAALIEAAVAGLAEKGAGVSVRDVAARAGVSPGLLRHHFGGFASLLAEAYRHTVQAVDARLDAAIAGAGEAPAARLRAFLEASFQPSIADRELMAAWIGFWGLVRRDPAAAAVHAEAYGAYRRRLEGLLADLAADRGLQADVRLGAIGLSAVLDGLWLELCLDPATFTPDEAVAAAAAAAEGLLRSAQPPG